MSEGTIDFNQIDQRIFYQAVEDGVRDAVTQWLNCTPVTVPAAIQTAVERAAADGLIHG